MKIAKCYPNVYLSLAVALYHCGHNAKLQHCQVTVAPMKSAFFQPAAMLLLAALSAADAAPNIPPSELPGRERYRFAPSPLDRFMQPQPQPQPLIRRECVDRIWPRSKQGAWRDRDC